MSDSDLIIDAHGIILFISWGVLADISMFFIRYMKTYKHYILIHTILFWLVFLSTVAMEIAVIYNNYDNL